MNNKKDILFNTVYNACYSDIAENRLRPKFIAKSASLIFRYIYIYIYISKDVYYWYKTRKNKTSKLYTTFYALSVRRATISLSLPPSTIS